MRKGRLVLLCTAALAAVASGVGVAAQAQSGGKPSFREQRVEIRADGYTIPGVFTFPRGGGKHAAVLMLHGNGSQKDEVGDMYKREAAKLAAQGIASLRIDFAGAGESTLPQTALTMDEMLSDADTALTWLAGRNRVDPDRLGVLGFSLGGRVASIFAGTDERVQALATWSTWAEPGATAVNVFGPEAYATAQAEGQVTVDLGFRTWTYSLAFFESIKASNPLVSIADYDRPQLGVDGTADFLWPETKDLLRASGSLDALFHGIEGADHIYQVLTPDQTNAEEAMDVTADWYASRL